MAVSAAMIRAKFTPEDLHMYRVTFEQFDEDGSGKIDVGELQRALRGCGIECTGDEVIAMMSTVDESGDLEIDFDEFLQLIYNFRTEQEYASTSESSDDDDNGGGGGGGGGRYGAARGGVHGGGATAMLPNTSIVKGGKKGSSSTNALGFGDADEALLFGLGPSVLGVGGGGGRKSRHLSNADGGGRRSSLLPAARRGSLVGDGHHHLGAGGGRRDSLDDGAADDFSSSDPIMLHRRRVAAVQQCPEHSLRALVNSIRQIREDLVRTISDMDGDSAEDERKIIINALQRLLGAKCPFVPSGSYLAAARRVREQQIAAMLSSTRGNAADDNTSNTNVSPFSRNSANPSAMPSPATTALGPVANNTSTTTTALGMTNASSSSASAAAAVISPPSITQIISFIDELLDAANERMMTLVNMTLAFNSDGLYDSAQAEDEILSKQQQELLKLVEAAAAVSGSGAKAVKKLQSSPSSPHFRHRHAHQHHAAVAGGGEGEDDSTSATEEDDEDDGNAGAAEEENRERSAAAAAAAASGRGKASDASSPRQTVTTIHVPPTPTAQPQHGSSLPSASSPPQQQTRAGRRQNTALDSLSTFTFELERSADQKIGSDAFRAAAKRFPYFMFPIGSVCTVIDNLEKVHDAYERALEGKEFLVKPRCKDGGKCKLLGILEHQLALSHPCYSDTIPCPHRHRPLHMTCYHHDEDENPSAQATLREMEKQLFLLDLTGLEMGDTGAKCIAHVLSRDIALRGKEKHRIRHLKIGGNQISPEGAAVLFEHCGHLLTLDISNNGLGYKGSMLAGSAIGPALQKLLTTSDSQLTELNLSRNRLSDRDAKYITEALKDNTVLTTLDVQKNEFGMLFGSHMASALQENRELKVLSLGWNRLESVGTTTLLTEVCKSSTIEYLDLSWTGVSDEGAQLLADFVAGSMILRHLGLAHNSITGDGLTTLKGAGSQSTLSKALQASKSLTSLDISFNNLGTKAARDFLRDMRENFVLETLDVRCVKATDEMVAEEVKNYVKVRATPPSPKPITVQFGSSVAGVNAPTNPINAERMGMEKMAADSKKKVEKAAVDKKRASTSSGAGNKRASVYRN